MTSADVGSLRSALDGQDLAYYLVHSLAHADFAERDRVGARAFGGAAAAAGVSQIVYLGGLGEDDDALSPHLRSRREVERILSDTVPTTALRAGIVIGDGSISWEILRQLVERLPAMVTPRWVQTRTQPIALADAVRFLVGVAGLDAAIGETYEIGGPHALSYRDMLVTVAAMTGRRRVIVPVPVLTPRLSSQLAPAGDRRRPDHSGGVGRLDDQRGRRARPPHRGACRPPADGLPRGGGRSPRGPRAPLARLGGCRQFVIS